MKTDLYAYRLVTTTSGIRALNPQRLGTITSKVPVLG